MDREQFKQQYIEYMQHNQYQKAVELCDKYIEEHPADSLAYLCHGTAKNDLKLYEEAIKDFDESIRLNPNDATAYNNRGLAKNNLKRYEEAIKDYNEAVRLEPNNALYLQNKFVTEQLIRDRARDEENQKFRDNLEEQYEKRKQELEEQYRTIGRLKITDGFLKNVNEFKAAKDRFLKWTLGVALTIFILIIIVVFVDIASVKNLKLYERYLLLSPILFVEFILYSGYVRNRNLETFYKHNLTVGNSLFEIRSEFFKGSDGNISDNELGEYRKFGLIQYEKLYEQPRLLDKHSLLAKNGKKEFSYANSSGNDSNQPKEESNK